MYSPLLMTSKPTWWPAILPFSAAMLILWAPGGFRFTCYYYRGAYYKAFWADPPNCAVGEPRSSYWGEKKFPLIMQNAHRYFLYIAILFVFILSYDAIRAMFFTAADGTKHFGIGVGTLVLIANPILLGLYTFGCHSFRHLIGGRKDVMRDSPARKKAYDCASCLNRTTLPRAWVQHVLRGIRGSEIRLCDMGNLARLGESSKRLSTRHTNSTCWWWERAALVCARRWKRRWRSARGCEVQLHRCEAHTVMAEAAWRWHGQRGRPRQLARTFRGHDARRGST